MMQKQKNILLVDDDEFLLDMYAVKFKSSGFNIEIARGGEEALAKLKEGFSPDIILLDLVMSKMSGFEFLEEVKKDNKFSCRVVILSNLGQKEDIEKGKKFGISDYIVKAYLTPSEVVEKVKSLLAAKP